MNKMTNLERDIWDLGQCLTRIMNEHADKPQELSDVIRERGVDVRLRDLLDVYVPDYDLDEMAVMEMDAWDEVG